ncbi:MAG TPA: hypothetical protein VIO61_07545 [Anaerolineaceae bacterium]
MNPSTSPTLIEVLAPFPEGWGICLTCEAFIAQAKIAKHPQERGMEAFPRDWQADFERLSDFILALSVDYGDAIRLVLYDPRSIQGMWRAIRHGARRYPAFLVKGRGKVVGLDRVALDALLQPEMTAPKGTL